MKAISQREGNAHSYDLKSHSFILCDTKDNIFDALREILENIKSIIGSIREVYENVDVRISLPFNFSVYISHMLGSFHFQV